MPLLGSLGTVVATNRDTLDIGDAGAVESAFRELRPSIVVNAAAYTAVDRAESERAQAFAINADRARACSPRPRSAPARCSCIIRPTTCSTGVRASRIRRTRRRPRLSVYGASKLEGEQRIAASGAQALVFRTSWIYGLRGSNFLLTIRRLAAERDELRIVDDQVGVPNWSRALARATLRVLQLGRETLAERGGLYHLSCGGEATLVSLRASVPARHAGRACVTNCNSRLPDAGAASSRTGCSTPTKFRRTFGFALPDWRAALDECLASPPEPA